MIDPDPASEAGGRDARRFATLARHLASYGSRSTASQAIAEAAVEVIGCSAAGVARAITGDTVRYELPGAGPDSYVSKIAKVAAATGEGPGAEALRTGQAVLSPDLEHEQRWPQYTSGVLDRTPMRTALVFPLTVGAARLGVVALYDEHPGFFTPARCAQAGVYADHAAIALSRAVSEERADGLQTAVQSNRRIGQATGILMARYAITDDNAFDVLRLASQALNRKLRDVAEDVVTTGDLPDDLGLDRTALGASE